mgnify:CR=1 FL=1
MEGKEGFVKREYGRDYGKVIAQVGVNENSEEPNLVHKIEIRTENLLKDLNSIESSTNALNQMLLPPKQKTESEAKEARKSQGWLENHLERLEFAIHRSGQIYEHVTGLMQATKTELK